MRRAIPPGRLGRARGLSLVELIIFIVVVTVALAGVLSVLQISTRYSADPLMRKEALALSEAMMDEILSKDYQNDPNDATNTSATLGCTAKTTNPTCLPNVPAHRANYNDVDDFNGWSWSPAQMSGVSVIAPLPCLTTVLVAAPAPLDGVNGKLITVTTTCGAETVALQGFRGNV